MSREFVVSYLLLSAVFVSGPVLAEPPPPPPAHELTVTGEAFVRTPPDRAAISIEANAAAATAGEAEQVLEKKLAAIQDAAKKAGGEGVIVAVAGKQFIGNGPGGITPKGQVTVQLTANLELKDLSKVGATIDAVLSAGAATVSDVTYFVRDVSGPRKSALEEATRNAVDQAKTFSAASGLALGAIRAVDVGEENAGSMIARKKREGEDAASLGDEEIHLYVTMRYELVR